VKSVAQIHPPGHYIWGIYTVAVFGGVILTPLVLSQYGYSPLKVLLATILLGMCLFPTAHYFADRAAGLPAFPVLCLAYAFQFAIPIFTREPVIQMAYGRINYLNDDSIITALILSVLGVGALLLGYYRLRSTALVKTIPAIGLHLNEKKAALYCVVIGVLAPLLPNIADYLPQSPNIPLMAVVKVLQSQALVAIAIMGSLIYSGKGKPWYKILLYWMIGLTVMQGLSTGMIEQVLAPIAALLIIKWQVTKRFPFPGIIFVVLMIFFLSPVKESFRLATWYEDTRVVESPFDKARLWLTKASQYWAGTLSSEDSLSQSTEQATSRMDLIHQFALVCSLTPSEVPYQYGATYSYFLVTLIPRAIWPGKPEAGASNKFFGVSYGLTTEEGAARTTFGVNLVAESYINFGWAGVLSIMAIQGAFLCLLQRVFGEDNSGAGGQAVYVSFFVFFLNGIGSSADMLFGNILQSALLSCALLWWMREKSSTRRSQETNIDKQRSMARL
jgi:hypothetical protein